MTENAIARFHRLTSYEPGRAWDEPIDDPWIRQDIAQNDPALRPPPVKRYPDGLEVVQLPREWPAADVPTGDALAGHVPATGAPLDLPALARLLHLSAGVVRVTQKPDRPLQLYRAAGSAGGRFPMELYVAARAVAGLEDAVWWYDPEHHALRRVGPAAAGDGATTLVVTGVPWRTGWRYAERGYRHIWWDTGTMLSQLLALAATGGIEARLWSRFPDARVTELVGADGVHEFPVALVALGAGEPAVDAGGPAEQGAVDDEPQEYRLVTAAQRAGDADVLGDPWPTAPAVAPIARPTAPLDEVILRRGSTRLMKRTATVARDLLDWPMTVALRGIDVPHFVVANGVDGLEPGAYRWPDLGAPLPTLATRKELYRVALDQALPGDAAYVVIAAADLSGLDARGYRDVQLAAGLVEGRLHLAAYALGLGASGMTFLDSEVPALLGAPLAGLLWTCVGVPEYPNRPGGPPGKPVTVHTPMPRMDRWDE